MGKRPDYVPATWIWGPITRWVAAKPNRVMAWFCAFVPMALVLLVIGLTTGSTIFVITGITGSIGLGIQGAIYVPRAWRAMHGDRTPSSN
jgi:hypothetical protein